MSNNLLGRVPTPMSTVQWREFGTEAILLDPTTGEYSQINETGVLIWKCMDGRRTVQQIAEALALQFDRAAPEMADEIGGFIEELAAKRLVVIG